MKKLILLALFVLILMSITWFRPAFCNENVNDSLINSYLKENPGSLPTEKPKSTYSSPDYFTTDEENGTASDVDTLDVNMPSKSETTATPRQAKDRTRE